MCRPIRGEPRSRLDRETHVQRALARLGGCGHQLGAGGVLVETDGFANSDFRHL